ncbi:MAG TPA: hypothetical protein PK587_13765 [Syntrophales bacterium]|nr:hypothetical protein [Syntrophales bacterium]
MDTLPVIQTFFGKPVRFFKTEFEVEEHSHNGNAPHMNFVLETWAMPLPDYSRAIGYPIPKIFVLIQRSKEVFDGFYRYESIYDAQGHRQRTIIMAIEMCDMLTAKLHTSRIKDPATRAAVIKFQRWTIHMFCLIRRGKLRPVRFQGAEIPADYLTILSLPPGRETRKAVVALAQKENLSEQQIYRRCQKLTSENMRTRKGEPRRARSDKGEYRTKPEYLAVKTFIAEHPEYLGNGNRHKQNLQKEIRGILGLSISEGTINRWIREAAIVH